MFWSLVGWSILVVVLLSPLVGVYLLVRELGQPYIVHAHDEGQRCNRHCSLHIPSRQRR